MSIDSQKIGFDTAENEPCKVCPLSVYRSGSLLLLLLLQIAQVDEDMIKTTNYLWSVHFAMATMTTVGYGDVSPTNTAELVYC